MTLALSTLRPGLLVSLKTSIRGNVSYEKTVLEDETNADGSKNTRWETERKIVDADEHARARKARGKARTLIRSVCTHTAFGMLCPEIDAEKLDAAIEQGQAIVAAFNKTASVTRASVYVLAGRIAADDVQAVKAINSEVRDLLEDMAEGMKNLDVAQIRKSAARAKEVGAMLAPDAQARAYLAIETVRKVAREIVKAGEQAAVAVDNAAIARVMECRTAFLDIETGDVEIAVPQTAAVAIDLTPETAAPKKKAVAAPQLELGE